MTIPDCQTVMLPLLRFAADQQEHSVREAIEELAAQFHLTDEKRKELLPSGRQATFDNRVGWARTYMKKAGLLESLRRSYFRITDRGLQALKTNPQAINNKFLEQYPEFREFKAKSTTRIGTTKIVEADPGTTQIPEQTPREVMENTYDAIRAQLASELLEQIMSSSPRYEKRDEQTKNRGMQRTAWRVIMAVGERSIPPKREVEGGKRRTVEEICV